MKKSFMFIMLLAFSAGAFAQISFGPKVGMTLSKYGYNYSSAYEYSEPEVNFKLGPQFGVMMDLQILEFLWFQPSLMYSKKGVSLDVAESESGEVVITGYDREKISYLELPLNLALGLKLGPVRFQVFAGPYFAYAIAGKNVWDYEENDGGIRTDITGSSDFEFVGEMPEDQKDNIVYQRPFDAGVDFGLGFQVNKVLLNLGFAMGFANLQPEISGEEYDAGDIKYANRTIFLNAAWLFGK